MLVFLETLAIAAVVYALHRYADVQTTARLGSAYGALLAIAVAANAIGGLPAGWVELADLPSPWWILGSALLGLALFLADFTIHGVVSARTIVVDVKYLLTGEPPLGGFIAANLITVLEEMLFRAQLAGALGVGPAFLLATGVMFGFAHTSFGPYAVVSKMILGFILGLVYVATGSVLCSVVVHVVYNWFAMIQRSVAEVVA